MKQSIASFEPGEMTVSAAMEAAWLMMSRSERGRALLIGLFSAAAGALELISVFAVYPLVNMLVDPDALATDTVLATLWQAAGEPDSRTFAIGLTVAAVLLLIAGSAASFLAQVTVNRFAAACQERLGQHVLEALLSVPYAWFLTRNPLLMGNLFANHIVVWSRDFVRRILMMCGQLTAIALPFVLVLAMAPLAGLGVIVVAAALTGLLLAVIRRRTIRLMVAKRAADERTHVFLTEALQGIKDVRLSSRETFFLKLFRHTYHVMSRNFSALNNWNLLPVQLVMMLGQIAILGVALAMFLSGVDGATLASSMALVVLVAARLVPAMNRFGTALNGLANMKPWVEVLFSIHQSLAEARARSVRGPDEIPGTGRKTWSHIGLHQVGFFYPESTIPALETIDLDIVRGQSVAFVGPSGAGKSTIVDLILGLLEPTSGAIMIDDRPLRAFGLKVWQKRIGYVPQTPLISDNTLKANIAFGVPEARIDDTRIARCLELAHLADIVAELPEGLDTPLGNRGHRLSGGQRQRVSIARALYNDPEILVLDEATSALDSESERAIRNAIVGLRGKVTVISIAHRFSTICDCDLIVLMDGGQIVAQGTYETLLRESDLFARLAGGTGLTDAAPAGALAPAEA